MDLRLLCRRGALVSATVVVFLVATGVASAQWFSPAQTEPSSAVSAVLPAGPKPAAEAAGGTVTVTWRPGSFPKSPAVGYRVVRYDPGGRAVSATGGCAGRVSATTCVEPGVPAGTWRYTITPVLGQSWSGAESEPGDPVTVPVAAGGQLSAPGPVRPGGLIIEADFSFGTAQVAAPYPSGELNQGEPGGPSQRPGPLTNRRTVNFTVSEPSSTGPARIQCAVDGSAFTGCTSPVPVGPLAEGLHRFSARRVNDLGTAEPVAVFEWTIDTTGPAGVDVQTADHGGVAGRPEAGDTITFGYREAVRPESIVPGWAGDREVPVTVRIRPDAEVGCDVLTVSGAGDGIQLWALGRVHLGRSGYAVGEAAIGATLRMSDRSVVVTLTAPAGPAVPAAPAVEAAGGLEWFPHGGIDFAGNVLVESDKPVMERVDGVADVEF